MIATLSRSILLLVLAPLALLFTAGTVSLPFADQTQYLLHCNNPKCKEAESRRMQCLQLYLAVEVTISKRLGVDDVLQPPKRVAKCAAVSHQRIRAVRRADSAEHSSSAS